MSNLSSVLIRRRPTSELIPKITAHFFLVLCMLVILGHRLVAFVGVLMIRTYVLNRMTLPCLIPCLSRVPLIKIHQIEDIV